MYVYVYACMCTSDTLIFSTASAARQTGIDGIDCRHRRLQLQDAVVTIAEIVSQILFVAPRVTSRTDAAKCVFMKLYDVSLVYRITTCAI